MILPRLTSAFFVASLVTTALPAMAQTEYHESNRVLVTYDNDGTSTTVTRHCKNSRCETKTEHGKLPEERLGMCWLHRKLENAEKEEGEGNFKSDSYRYGLDYEARKNAKQEKVENKPAEGKKETKDSGVSVTKNATVVVQPVVVHPMMASVQSFGMTDALVQQSMRGSSMFAASAERLFANREQALDQAVAGVSSGDSMVQGADVWVEGTMGRLSRKAMANHSKLKQDTAALAAGVGVALTDRTTVGVALSRGDSTSRQGVAKSQAEQTDVSLYGLTALTDRFYTSGTIGTGVIENRDRIISNVATGAAQRAKYRTKGHHASAELGYSQPAMEGRATINPYVSLSVLQLDTPRVTYRDVAGREVMTMAGKKQTFTTAKLGVRGALLVLDRVALEGHAEWQQAVGSKSTTLQARTLTASGRTTDQTLRLGHVSGNSVNAGVAVVASLSKDADVRVGYDVEKGRRFVGHRGNVSLRFRF